MRALRLTTLTPVFVIGAAGLWGQSAPAPLAESTKELHNLLKTPAAAQQLSGNASAGYSIPAISVASPETSASPRPVMEQDVAKLKLAPTNWLVDGVRQLEKQQKSQRGAGEKLSEKELEDQIGEVSGASREAELATVRGASEEQLETSKSGDGVTGKTTRARPDALAPFLARWLNDSPVDGKFFNEFARGGDSAAAASSSLTTGEVHADGLRNQAPAATGLSASSEKSPNPYLAAAPQFQAEPNLRPGFVLGEGNRGDSTAAAPSLPPSPGLVAPIETPAAITPSKNALPAIADDKKYFPQQRKF